MGSFISALGGLRAHQSWIDIIGNNLANASSPGFKQSRALFGDLLSITQKPATGPGGSVGGTNAIQTGLGVRLSQVNRSEEQGVINLTGRTFDLAILGSGYFAVTDGNQNLYTRVGAFGVDADGTMVDLRTGNRVLDASGQTFQIDANSVIPPTPTSTVQIGGNLPAEVTGPLFEQLASSSTITEGTQATMTGTAQGPFNIPVGEAWSMDINVNGSAPQTVSIVGTGAITATDVANAINTQTTGVTASVTATQEIVLTSNRTGNSSSVQVTPGPTGRDLKGLVGMPDFIQGTETAAALATDLNSLTSNTSDYQVGDVIEINGTDVDGAPVVAAFTYGVDGTTIGDFVTALDTAYPGASVTFDASTGKIEILADSSGEASLTLLIDDGTGSAGQTNWANHFFEVVTNGVGPDTVTTSSEIFDSLGTAHILTQEFVRQDDGTWNMTASIPPEEGSVIAGSISGITFNQDGSILSPATGSIEIQFNGLASQNILVELGSSGQVDGLTQFGGPPSAVVESQDGLAAGSLTTMQVDQNGSVLGFYSNGQTATLGNFGIATFANEGGLEEVGDTYLRETPNSGQRSLGLGSINGAGGVVGGALEGSNVDTAEEFVHLIEAQRGFQANARVISVQNEILAEVVNII